MGGYKDDQNYGPLSIYPSSDPQCGTIPLNQSLIATSGDAIAYATAKLAGERCAINLAKLYGDTTTFVVLRIGWCQESPVSVVLHVISSVYYEVPVIDYFI